MSVFLLLASPVFSADAGTKTMIDEPTGCVIQVPQSAPEFLRWPAMAMGSEKYPNGNALALIESVNEDATVTVRSLWAMIDGKLYLLAFGVAYEAHPDKIDLYQDVGFLDTGVPTGRFLQVAESAPLSLFKSKVGGVRI
jgi:hypothetical protein